MLGILYGWRKRNEGEVFEERYVKATLVELPQGTARVSIAHMSCAAIEEGKTKIVER